MIQSSVCLPRNTRLPFKKVPGSHQALRAICSLKYESSMPIRVEVPERRAVLLGTLAVCGVAVVPSSEAGVLDGTVEWWKARKRANSAKLIAPIKVAQQRLEAASTMLADGSGRCVDTSQF
ncbi:hypothetical protein Vretimale_15780 [Volvox reticuliferus]|uniref:Uncharacterized protein n=1 Tax=Volvox reticuliferus TaxID=1737510 RepID=A0A8J4LWI9_9CHLO|nr:hypothetical protein Vretimale_15780 [Volvox reticuliferus]